MSEPHVDGTLLVLDDEEPVRRSMSRLLERRGYDVRTAADCTEATALLDAAPISLILCDIDLAGESGLEFAEHVSPSHPDTAVIMVTGVDDANVAQRALDAGAYGYIIKPFEVNELVINVANGLRRRTLEIERNAQTTQLEWLVGQRTEQLRHSHEELIQRLMSAADFRDPETASHLQRMSRYSALLAQLIGQTPEECELIRLAAPMHDIGKLGIPDEILCKPGRFTDEDREIMKQHTEMGFRILDGSASALIQLAGDIAHTHHEWVDGTGYPRGLGVRRSRSPDASSLSPTSSTPCAPLAGTSRRCPSMRRSRRWVANGVATSTPRSSTRSSLGDQRSRTYGSRIPTSSPPDRKLTLADAAATQGAAGRTRIRSGADPAPPAALMSNVCSRPA